ncbi:MAG: Gluconate 5-dehydrogenase, partial [uncultured Craurococcus sp.]
DCPARDPELPPRRPPRPRHRRRPRHRPRRRRGAGRGRGLGHACGPQRGGGGGRRRRHPRRGRPSRGPDARCRRYRRRPGRHRGAPGLPRLRQQCRHFPPRPIPRGDGGRFRCRAGAEPPRLLFRGASGRPPHGGRGHPRLHHQHLLADGPCRRPQPQRLLREQMGDGGLDQGDGDRARPAWHPRQHHRPHLHRDAHDPALLRAPRIRRLGAEQDQARPPRSGAGPDGPGRLPRLRRLRADDRLRNAHRWRLDRRV